MVTAELAMGLPLLVALTWVLAWLLSLGVAQVRVVDAARETARAVARGDPVTAALSRGRQVAPAGADLAVRSGQGEVVVTATARVSGPGGLLGLLPGVRLEATAVAAAEYPP